MPASPSDLPPHPGAFAGAAVPHGWPRPAWPSRGGVEPDGCRDGGRIGGVRAKRPSPIPAPMAPPPGPPPGPPAGLPAGLGDDPLDGLFFSPPPPTPASPPAPVAGRQAPFGLGHRENLEGCPAKDSALLQLAPDLHKAL